MQGDVKTQNYCPSFSINEFLCLRDFGRHGDLGKLEKRGIRSEVGKREKAKQMLA